MIKSILDKFSEVVEFLNKTSIKRLFIYAIILYPICIAYFYNDEIKMLFEKSNSVVVLEKIAKAQERCFDLRKQYNAEAVMLYVYQPKTKQKHYKERVVFSTSNLYKPIEKNKRLNLASQSRILEDLKRKNISIIKRNSDYKASYTLFSYKLEMMVITPIMDSSNEQIIGEVYWVFKNKPNIDYNKLFQEAQLFSYFVK